MHTKYLATDRSYYPELEIRSVCAELRRLREACHSLLTRCLNRCLFNDSSANTSTEEACKDRLVALW